jgi:aminoglycoside phosphotransferase (APT) family kinase protein
MRPGYERGERQPVKMHADEMEIDAKVVRRLLAEQFPRWAGLPLHSVEPRGTDNALFRLGEEMVARLPRRDRTVAPLLKECRWLPQLAPSLPLPVPVPLAEGTPGEGHPLPWAVYRWIEGETAMPEHIGDRHAFAADLAGFIRALREIDASDGPAPGEHNFQRGAPLTALDTSMRQAIAALEGTIDTAAVTALWETALEAPPWDRPPVWVHGDLDARNLLVHGGRLTAVIDFGGLGVGDPACDMMAAWKLFASDARRTFLSALGIDDSTRLRARGWVVFQVCAALSFYTMETNPTLVLQARRWLEAVLGEADGME